MIDKDVEKFKHRDLNWLSFNERVLQEAEDKNNPVYERLKFLAIFSSNLDEFYRVRVSQLRQIKRIDKSLRKKLALRPSKIIKEIIARTKVHQQRFGDVFQEEIIPELAENNIFLIGKDDFNKTQQKFAAEYFKKKIEKKLLPEILDFSQEKEVFLENNTIYFLVDFKNSEKCGLVNIPIEKNERFVIFPTKSKKHFITFTDDVLRSEINSVFPKHKISGVYEVKISRDAELYLDDEIEGTLAEKIYDSLEQRTDGQPTRLLYDANMPEELAKKFRKYLGLGKIDMMPGGKYHNFSDFLSFPDPSNNKKLHDKKLHPIPHKAFEKSKDYFKTISQKDRLVHFPFMSFGYVENFIEQAANDKNVTALKISLYRVADESRLTSLLLKALENGKKVTVFVEAKARFDEENNIVWGRKFEEKGANVIYSYPRIKVHSKILLVQRAENGKNVNYAYIGTGNFNSETSKIYCDHGLFTAHKKIAKDLERVFRVLERELIVPRTKDLLISPFNTRRVFSKLIEHEIEQAENGKKAEITIKMNSMEDEDMINLLYKASNAGVKIRLLVRGFLCLIPEIKGMSENIFATSILDRFLEHGRIYVFHHGGDEQIYMGSADWMVRNLDRRIEVLAPIYDKAIASELKDILNIQLSDNVKARIQDLEESNCYIKKKPKEKAVRSQSAIYEYLKKKHA
ncbi:MAG TPA: polyphosphate kinase 1 [Flavobacteriaceae bacterium]|nr:polyphosphate kinase 1 [Flavobacteriaceae bacterium]